MQPIHYIHDAPTSWLARSINLFLKISFYKGILKKLVLKVKKPVAPFPPPSRLRKTHTVAEQLHQNRPIWTIAPKENAGQNLIFYLHGGGYIRNMSLPQWSIVSEIAATTDATIVVLDYPLAPFDTYEATYAFVNDVYKQLLSSTKPENIIFMGDSAGGGLALGFAQQLRNEGQPQPQQVILLAPWLDATMSNPEVVVFDKADRLLDIEGLQIAGKLYAGNQDPKHYQISPMFGNLDNLPKISIFVGTNDIFTPDCRALQTMLQAQNRPHNYYEYPKMIHVWIAVTMMPESQSALRQITDLIQGQR
jgi:acetyl esterase/lipase